MAVEASATAMSLAGCLNLRHFRLTADINPLTPNDHYSGRTAPLTSKRFILYIYSKKYRY